jgi:hypothetical protein
MQGRAKLTPIQVLERLQLRLEQRMESLQRVKLDGYHVVISELETELDLLRRAQRYLEDWDSRGQIGVIANFDEKVGGTVEVYLLLV